MTPIKRMDLFVLKKFLPIFFGAFFIVLFVFIMQFTWGYVDTLIGKGLTLDLLAEFFWYMSITLVPMSLPLAVLLASLISFGNMGERLELLAMKAAGIPLLRIMAPVGLLVAGLTGMSFYFQNKTAPEAQLKLRALIYSMKQTSPALEIPEGVFYNGVPNFNLYVDHKDVGTGKLYDLMVYKTDQGFDKAQIVVADSGRMQMTDDKLHLILDIWNGEQYENLRGGEARQMGVNNQPSDRETFNYKRFIIDFDSNFDRMDEDQLRGMATVKNLEQLDHDIDSLNQELDSVGHDFYLQLSRLRRPYQPQASRPTPPPAKGTLSAAQRSFLTGDTVKTDGIDRSGVLQRARSDVSSAKAELEWRSSISHDDERYLRRHRMEWHNKFTLSLSCLFFFFIGAPLGAIIRKGGLGMPALVSVAVFVIYFVINTFASKMARDGNWNLPFGMWLSSVVLAPTGIFLTYKSNRDSMVFNLETYTSVVKRFLGIRSARHITRKEVIIHDPDYLQQTSLLETLREDIGAYLHEHRLYRAPNYVGLFFRPVKADAIGDISARMEAAIEELANSRDVRLLNQLNRLPQLYTESHAAPFRRRWMNTACGVLLPLGIVFWIRAWRFRLRLLRDLHQTDKTLAEMVRITRELSLLREVIPHSEPKT